MSPLRIKVEIPSPSSWLQMERMKDLSVVTSRWPQVMRFGPGSLDEQIRYRTHFTPAGGQVAWQEPSYASGGNQDRVGLLEDVMWQGVRGGVGSITRSTPFTATVGVDDSVVRQRSAQLGNQIVSNAPYFGFVTGEFQERTGDSLAKPSKPTKSGKGEFPMNTAMFWFLLLQFGYKASAEELSAGLSVPPKNMGFNPIMRDRLKLMTETYIATGAV